MPDEPVIQEIAMGSLRRNFKHDGGKVRIGQDEFEYGIPVHARSCLRAYSPEPIKRFMSNVGVPYTGLTRGNVQFYITANGAMLNEPVNKKGGAGPSELCVAMQNETTTIIELVMDHSPENPSMNRGVWAEPLIETVSGKIIRLDRVKQGVIPCKRNRYPFSFTYDGAPSEDLLPSWEFTKGGEVACGGKVSYTVSWQQPGGGLKASLDITEFADFPAVEILPWFENTSGADTGLIENIQSLDAVFSGMISAEKEAGGGEHPGNTDLRGFYRLHKSRPDLTRTDQYINDAYEVDYLAPQRLGVTGGRCSDTTLPFFKVETGYGAIVFGLGWMAQWAAELSTDGHFLNVKAGQELTSFYLHPGERVRQVRALMLNWEAGGGSDSWEANTQFRRLIYKHYAAERRGRKQLPLLWAISYLCGISLFQDTAAEHLAMIRAYSEKLKGMEAYVVDAGWFNVGFCGGEGNYLEIDYKRWPEGVGPVALEAKKAGYDFGLWFDIERTYAGTKAHRDDPGWFIEDKILGSEVPYLLRWFGAPGAARGSYEQTAHYMAMDGFTYYRQDFNNAPITFWRSYDKPGRTGIYEALHVMGMLEYWQLLADNYPGALREECASGGYRIDLDTVSLMHIHQKSDLWGVPSADQSACMGLGQYLPNNCFHGFCTGYTEYEFRSVMAASMCYCLGDIIKDGFDPALAQRMVDEYLEVRHLLTDAWYPLTKQTIEPDQWLASQYHRADLGEGMVLAFRREQSPYSAIGVGLRWIDPGAEYILKYFSFPESKTARVKGSELMDGFTLGIPHLKASEIMTYKRVN